MHHIEIFGVTICQSRILFIYNAVALNIQIIYYDFPNLHELDNHALDTNIRHMGDYKAKAISPDD